MTEDEQVCPGCREIKPLEEFALSRRSRTGRQGRCRACQHAYYVASRARNVARARSNKRAAVLIARAFVRDHLATHPCTDCGERDLAVLDFDHIRDKRLDVTRMAFQGFALETIRLEIEKCEVRCANCHRRRTSLHRQWQTTRPLQARRGGRSRELRPKTHRPIPPVTVGTGATQRCARCGRILPLAEFNVSSRHERQYWCRTCQSAYYAARSTHHKALVTRNTAVYSARNREFVSRYLLEHPCIDCGETDAVVLEFDHVRDKLANVSRLRRWCGLEKLKAEIAKCEVRCANCHRRKTAVRRCVSALSARGLKDEHRPVLRDLGLNPSGRQFSLRRP